MALWNAGIRNELCVIDEATGGTEATFWVDSNDQVHIRGNTPGSVCCTLDSAERILAAMGDRPPKTTEEVYAREQIRLDQQKSTEVVLQAIRVGSIAIAARRAPGGQ